MKHRSVLDDDAPSCAVQGGASVVRVSVELRGQVQGGQALLGAWSFRGGYGSSSETALRPGRDDLLAEGLQQYSVVGGGQRRTPQQV